MGNDFEIIPQEEMNAAYHTMDALVPDSSIDNYDVLALVLIATQRQNKKGEQ